MIRFLRGFRVFCTVLGALLLLVTFIPAATAWMARQLEVDWYSGDGDVLVVLGGAMLVDGTGPQSVLGYDSYLRCAYASGYLQQYRYKYVVVSGPDGLAESMARFLEMRGVLADQMLIENSARTTEQNAEFVKTILDHQSGLPAHPLIAVLTSDYHTRRARRVFERYGMVVHAIPVPHVNKALGSVEMRWDAFLTVTTELAKLAGYKVEGKI
jgi:uncharacterized SAM-binding protein YcdF (DUF218 family)